MRNGMLAFALLLAATTAGAHAAEPELLRVELISGLYSVEAPSTWHLEESGRDLTATLSESPDSGDALYIAAPNPLINDPAAFNRQLAESLLQSFGNGVITKEESTESTHTLWIAFKPGGKTYLSWSQTIRFEEEGVSVQAMTLSTMANFAAFMKTAAPILASYELNADMTKENAALLAEVGQKVLASLEK